MAVLHLQYRSDITLILTPAGVKDIVGIRTKKDGTMDMGMALWLVGGAIALLVMLIVVVTIARSMDKGGPAIKTNIPQ
ncbi:MAG: hypothetical protein EON93_12875, partial [Burkholderiales bacterium]